MRGPTTEQERTARVRHGGLRIGQVAKLLGMSVRTVRYYEDCGLLPAPHRQESGVRVFLRGDIERLRQIQRLTRLLGYPLDEVRTLIGHEDELRRALATGRTPRDRRATLTQLELSLTRRYDESTQRLEWLTAHRARLISLIDELKKGRSTLERLAPRTVRSRWLAADRDPRDLTGS